MKAIEISGTIDSQGKLILHEKVEAILRGPVKVILLAPEEDEIDERSWLQSASCNKAFEFLNDPAEDIYSLSDGKDFNEK